MLSALGGDNLGSGGAVGLSWSLSAFDAGVVGSVGTVGLSCSLPCSLRNLTLCFMIASQPTFQLAPGAFPHLLHCLYHWCIFNFGF